MDTTIIDLSAGLHPISRVYNMDCMEAMRQIPDNFFQLSCVDPPYGIGADIVKETRPIKSKTYNKGRAVRKGYYSSWDIKPKLEYFIELVRVSKNQIIWGANYFIEHLSSSNCFIIWDKIQEFSGADFELAYTSFTGPSKAFRLTRIGAYSNGDWRSVLGHKIHPTQKPVALYKWLLTNYAKPGDKILDTHLGSGSSRIAAHDLGFDFWGFELDKDYFDASEKRFQKHIAQQVLPLEISRPEAEQTKMTL